MISEALDLVAPIISAIAAFFSAIAAYQSAKAAKGSTEIQIRQLIRNARLNYIKYYNKNKELLYNFLAAYQSAKAAKGSTEIQIRQLIRDARLNYIKYYNKNKELLYNFLIEDLNNAYDEACSKYNSGKICKKSFERMYKNEIKKHVEVFKPKEENYLDLYKVYNKFVSKKTNKIF